MRVNILLMSGQGKRFKSDGFTTPKPLLPVGEATMFEKAIENFPKCDKWFFTVTKEINQDIKFINFLNNFNDEHEVVVIDEITNGQATSAYLVTKNLIKTSEIFIGSCDAIIDQKLEFESFSNYDFSALTTLPSDFQLSNSNKYGWVVKVDNKVQVLCKETLKTEQEPKGVILGFFYFKSTAIFNLGYDKIVRNNLFINGELYIDTITKVLNEVNYKFLNKLVTASVVGTPSEYTSYLSNHYED